MATRTAQAWPDVSSRVWRYTSRIYSTPVSREWIGLLKQRIIKAHEGHVRMWVNHGS